VLGELSYMVESHTVKTPDDARNVIARLTQGPKAIDDTIANLTIGLTTGRVSSAEKIKRVVEQLDTELAKGVDAWAMVNPSGRSRPTRTRGPTARATRCTRSSTTRRDRHRAGGRAAA